MDRVTQPSVERTFSCINTWQRDGQNAPHKPLLILYALGRYRPGADSWIPFCDIDRDLGRLLQEYGPPRKAVHPEYPFWRLQHDGLWVVRPQNLVPRKGNTDPKKSEFKRSRAEGRLSNAVLDLLTSDPSAISRVSRLLLDIYFPASSHGSILSAVGLAIPPIAGSGLAEKTEQVAKKVPSLTEPHAGMVYLDHNATTPMAPGVLDAMMPYLQEVFGNAASRTHSCGRAAAAAVEKAREDVAALLGCEPREIVWTSGATESNNLAIIGYAEANRHRGRHIITQVTEHHAVLDPCTYLERNGFEVTRLPVDKEGRVSAEDVRSAVRADTILVSVMYGNNEVGTLQPVHEIASLCQTKGITFHNDAAQAVGKAPIDLRKFEADLLSFSAHKFYGPKGCGGLVIRDRSPRLHIAPIVHGGGHERGLRSGTLNVPAIVGTGAAARISMAASGSSVERICALRDHLEHDLLSSVPNTRINGCKPFRLPNVTNITFAGVEAEALMMALHDVAVSSGSACTSAQMQPSHVLLAMGNDATSAFSSVRFSLGRMNTREEIMTVIQRVRDEVAKLRELNPLYEA